MRISNNKLSFPCRFGESLDHIESETMSEVVEWLTIHLKDALEGKRAVISALDKAAFTTTTHPSEDVAAQQEEVWLKVGVPAGNSGVCFKQSRTE